MSTVHLVIAHADTVVKINSEMVADHLGRALVLKVGNSAGPVRFQISEAETEWDEGFSDAVDCVVAIAVLSTYIVRWGRPFSILAQSSVC